MKQDVKRVCGKQTKYCTDGCGYKEELQKQEHSSETKIIANGYNNKHSICCNVCGEAVKTEQCMNSKGEILGCITGIEGACVICGARRTKNHVELIDGKCVECGKKFYQYELSKEVISQTQIKIKYKVVPIIDGLSLEQLYTNLEVNADSLASATNYKFTKNGDGSIEIEGIINIAPNTPAREIRIRCHFKYSYEGASKWGYDTINIYPDNYAPTVKSIEKSGELLGEFSKAIKITAKFEETWDSVVEMALYDSDGTVMSNWSTATKDGTIFTKEFNVVTETTTSKELTVKAKDRCGNIGEGKVTIGKIDTKSPVLVSTTKYNDKWTIGKKIIVEATDEGSGNVQIALGGEDDYKTANKSENKYYRIYNFTGDVYEDIIRIVYLKDEVGNVCTNKITIGKMDCTSPTITNVNIKNKTVTIDANDINTKLNKEGSGISGYAVSKSKEVPTENAFQVSNTFNIEKTGRYYIWVKDNAGNLSEIKQIEV